MILFREKDEYDPKKQKQNNDTTVNIKIATGTTVADALEQKDELRKLGNALPKKIKYTKNLMQFYTGAFDLTVDEATVSYLRDEVSEMMLLRSDEATKQEFVKTIEILEKTIQSFHISWTQPVTPIWKV